VLGDCWFLGALSAVASRQNLIRKCVPSSNINPWGVYEISFYKNGKWISVVVDDHIPLNKNKPVFASSKDANEVWVMLLEKAYAKIHGGYENLEAGSEVMALVDLTGGAPETIALDSPAIKQDLDSVWKKIALSQSQGSLLGSARAVPGATEMTPSGIWKNHAYGLLQAVALDSRRKLLRVRNPWGEGEWKGRWSDGAVEWTPEILKKLNYQFGDDGTFWMNWEDFAKEFNRVYIVRLYDELGWQSAAIDSEWKGITAGGCVNFPTWKNNPQFALTLSSASNVMISLTQRDTRMEGILEFSIAMGMLVLKASDVSQKSAQIKPKDIVGQSSFAPAREASLELGLDAGTYLISATTYQPNQATTFTIRVYAESCTPKLTEIGGKTPVPPSPMKSTVSATTALLQQTEKLSSGKVASPSIKQFMEKPTKEIVTWPEPANDGRPLRFKGSARSGNSFYSTMSNTYGIHDGVLDSAESQKDWHGKSQKFTKSFNKSDFQ
jgi:hypothetical protein